MPDVPTNTDNRAGVNADGAPLVGNPETFSGEGIVAFIDLLGFSSAVLRDWDSQSSPLRRLHRIRAAVPTTTGRGVGFGSRYITDGKPIYSPAYHACTHVLSDSFTVSVALPARASHCDYLAAFVCAAVNVGDGIRAALDEGFAVRGGIELDRICWDKGEIMGPALVHAIALEKTASSARCLLGPKLLRTLPWAIERAEFLDAYAFLCRFADGLVGLAPRMCLRRHDVHLAGVAAKVRALQHAAGGNAGKYHELLQSLELATDPTPPNANDIARAVAQMGGVARA